MTSRRAFIDLSLLRRRVQVQNLEGGYLNDGGVYRVGDRVVRRQGHAWPVAVEEALAAMERRGFPGCPRQISRLDERSVVLSYMRGHAISDPPPPWATQKRTLRLVTRFLRSFSDASAGIRKEIEHADWLAPPLSAGDYLVHGDPHPTNLIFNRLRQPTAIIDFELATVGSDDWNLISLMFCWGPLEPLEATFWKNLSARFEIDERLAAILEMWDSPSSSSELVEAGRDFLEWRQRWIRRLAGAGNPGARAFLGSANFDARFAFAEARLKHALR